MEIDFSVIGILLRMGADIFGQLMHASFSTGLQTIEVTMNSPGAEEIIASNIDKVPSGKYLGIGNLRNLSEAERPIKLGPCSLLPQTLI